jgi:hypothetical protein
MMGKRGAYFFVIDAVMAGVVIVAVLMFIFGTYTLAPIEDPTLRSAEDFMNYVSNTKIRESDSDLIRNLTLNGTITRLDNTFMDQMVIFYYMGNNSLLENITLEIVKTIIPKDRGVLIYLNQSLIYNSTINKNASTINESRLLISSKRIGFHMINETLIYGPAWMEVKVWV